MLKFNIKVILVFCAILVATAYVVDTLYKIHSNDVQDRIELLNLESKIIRTMCETKRVPVPESEPKPLVLPTPAPVPVPAQLPASPSHSLVVKTLANHIHRQKQNVPIIKEIVDTGGYDSQLKNSDKNRLGFAVNTEFRRLPKWWNDILEEIKPETKVELFSISSQTTTTRFVVKTDTGSNPPKPEPEPVLTISRNAEKIQPIQILVETGNGWGDYHDENYCQLNKNPEYKCEFTDWPKLKATNGSLELRDVAGKFDVIFVYRDLFHKSDIQLDFDFDGNNRSRDEDTKIPKLIYFTLESPAPPNDWQMRVKYGNRKHEGRQRDLLASFWRGSDIYTPYFVWNYYDPKVTGKIQGRNYAEGRSKMAAIVVSNCLPNNNRMGLVRELRRHVQVDTFGKCGETECRLEDCFPNIQKNYKFYLSFENSNCRDYITEKVMKGYENDLLPIVLGAHPEDYKTLLPANSYIHIEDFESVQKLGEYLNFLNGNDTVYNSYFAWKGTGEFRYYGPGFMCELCSYLHAQNILAENVNNKNAKVAHTNLDPIPLTYFNSEDSYNFPTFNFSDNDTRLCLKSNLWYWNR